MVWCGLKVKQLSLGIAAECTDVDCCIHCVPKSGHIFVFLNNSVKNKPIWIISGIRNPEEMLHRCVWSCPPHLKNVDTVPCEMQKISFSTAVPIGCALGAWNCVIFSPMKNCPLHLAVNLQNYQNICLNGNQKWRALTSSYARLPYHFQRLHNGLNSSTAYCLTGCKNNLKHISTQKMVIFNNCCDVACLKFKLPCHKTTGCLRTIHVFEGINAISVKRMNFATFFRCGGQVQKHLCRISSGICVPNIIQIGLFLTELFKKLKCGHFFGTHTVDHSRW